MNKIIGIVFFSLLFVGSQGGVALAELPLLASEKSSLDTPRRSVPSNPSRILEIGDRVNLQVYPEDEYIKGVEMNISSEGNVILPLVGKIKIAGMSIIDAQRKLVRIIDADYLVDPEVVIEYIPPTKEEAVKEVLSVSVLGAVRSPGNYDLEIKTGKPTTLIQAVLAAGGFSDVANIKKIKIVRKSSGDGDIIRANAEAIVSGKNPDVELEAGDIIHVSESLF